MKSVTINGREFLFVEVPEDAIYFKISGAGFICYKSIVEKYWRVAENLNPVYGYRILCKASEAGEEQARQIVEKVSGWSKELFYGYGVKCSDYRDIVDSAFDTATESLHSLILSLGMEVGKTIILEKLK